MRVNVVLVYKEIHLGIHPLQTLFRERITLLLEMSVISYRSDLGREVYFLGFTQCNLCLGC